MKPDYQDIISKIDEQPLWWDANGVPRYKPFHPDLRSNIYVDEVALCHIKCQACGQAYLVEFIGGILTGSQHLALLIKDNALHYGDPPNFCCPAGATMTSRFGHVVEYWARINFDWVRRSELETKQPTETDGK